MIELAARSVAACAVMIAPGCWFAFRPSTGSWPVTTRIALAVVLSPLVITAQFYLLRVTGVPFGAASVVIAVVNLPALVPVLRSARDSSETITSSLESIALWLAFLSMPATYLFIWMGAESYRANYGHSWLHTGIIYVFANGQLRPEDPQLAGVPMAYPWLGDVYAGVVSFIGGRAPNSGYLLVNVLWLLATLVLVASVVRQLGGNRLARASTVGWLSFAVNVTGYVGVRVLPEEFLTRYPIWGDPRYSPWLRKFGVFESTIVGIGIFAAFLYVVSSLHRDDARRFTAFPLLVALLVSSALIYPVLFPATLSLAGAAVLYDVVSREPTRFAMRLRHAGPLVLSAAIACVLGLLYVLAIDVARAGPSAVRLTEWYFMKVKGATAVLVLAPLLAGCLITIRPLWRTNARLVSILLGGALGSLALNDLLVMPWFSNEYKFIYTATIALAPFGVIAFAQLTARTRGFAIVLSLATAALMSIPALQSVMDRPPLDEPPTIDVQSFNFTLAPSEPLLGATTAIRTSSPTTAVVVSRGTGIDLAAPSQRAWYVVADPTHGIGISSGDLLTGVRGYSAELVSKREAMVRALYDATTADQGRDAIDSILVDIDRPIAILLNLRTDEQLDVIMQQRPDAERIHMDDEFTVWLVSPRVR